MDKKGFWQKVRFRYRLSVMNENTLLEVWNIHLSKLGLFLSLSALFLLSFAIFAAIIWYTPLKNYLPGYNQNIRQELLESNSRLDSISAEMQLQQAYLSVIKDIVNGDIAADTIRSLDSTATAVQVKLLEENSTITQEFLEQYAEKERTELALYGTATASFTFFPPVMGKIKEPFNESQSHFYAIYTCEIEENVAAVLEGTVIAAYAENGIWTVVMQHDGDYVSEYSGLLTPQKKVGDRVIAGEAIALAENNRLRFALWHRGVPINPTEAIKE